MTKAGLLIQKLKTDVESVFEQNRSAQTLINGFVTFLLAAQKAVASKAANTIATMIPDGIGTLVLTDVTTLINVAITKAVPDIEIAGRCVTQVQAAIAGMTDPADIVNTALPIIITELDTLPVAQQDKHIVETVTVILGDVVDLPLKEIELLVSAELAKIQDTNTAVASAPTPAPAEAVPAPPATQQ